MNKCIYLTKKNLQDFYELKDIAKDCAIDLFPVISEIQMFTEYYQEKCPILMDDSKWYKELIGQVSSMFSKDVYLLNDDCVYQNDTKLGTIVDFFKSEVFKCLLKKQDRAQCSESIKSYLKDFLDYDWRTPYIIDVLGEMYYFDLKEPTDELLEYVFKKDRLEKDEDMPVFNKLKKILKTKLKKKDFKDLNDKKMFALLYADFDRYLNTI